MKAETRRREKSARTMQKNDKSPKRFWNNPISHLLLSLLIIALIQFFVVKQFAVPSESMEPTLKVGDRILIDRLAYKLSNSPGPEIGDMIVFSTNELDWPHSSQNDTIPSYENVSLIFKKIFGDGLGIGPTSKNMLVKRVIATDGQMVECCTSDGNLLINATEVHENFIANNLPFEPGIYDCNSVPRSQRCFDILEVPDGKLLVLGDNRGNSSDSLSECRIRSASEPKECARWVKEGEVVGRVSTIIWPLSRLSWIL